MSATWKKVIVSGSQAELAGVTGSFTGSFSGSGGGLTNIQWDNIVNKPQAGSGNLILSGSLTGSFTSNADGALTAFKIQSGSDANQKTLLTVSSSGMVSAGTSLSGSFTAGGLSGSRFLQNVLTGTNTNAITIGSLPANSNPSTAIKGWSEANALWNNSGLRNWVNEDTPISDILYFLLLPWASNFADAQPNPNTYASITDTGFTPPGTVTMTYQNTARVPAGTTTTIVDTYTGLNLHSVGGAYLANIPAGSTVYYNETLFTNAAMYNQVSSVRAGSSTPTSTGASAATLAFGMGSLNPADNYVTPHQFLLTASITYNTYTLSSNVDFNTLTFTSKSEFTAVKTTTGATVDTTTGIYLNKVTSNTTQKFVDGYFVNASLGGNAKAKWAASQAGSTTQGLTAPTNLNTMGWYHVTASVAVASRSYDGNTTSPITTGTSVAATTVARRWFFMPAAATTPTLAAISKTSDFTTLSVQSSSLSGAPYIKTVTLAYSESISNAFNPLLVVGNVYSQNTAPTIALGNVTNQNTIAATLPTAVAVSNATPCLVTTAGRVFDGNTDMNASTPKFNATIKSAYTITYTAASNVAETNIVNQAASTTIVHPQISVAAPTILRPGTSATAGTATTRNIVLSADLPSPGLNATNTMAWRKTDNGTFQRQPNGLTENFTSEVLRIPITNALLGVPTTTNQFTGASAFQLDTLGALDLQQKPLNNGGVLVTPGGANGYWLNAPAGNTDGYRYYATYFQAANTGDSNGFYNNLTLTLGQACVPWTNTTTANSISCLLLLQSKKASGGSTAEFVDIFNSNTTPWVSVANPTTGIVNANTSGLNPFSTDIKIEPNGSGGTPSTTTGVSSVFLDSGRTRALWKNASQNSNTAFVVLIRYKGDPTTPLTSISWAGSI